MEENDVIKRIVEVFRHNALDFTGTGKLSKFDNYLLMMKLSTERFTLKDIPKLSSRVFNHWKKNGLMPLEREEGRAKFSFIEYIWLNIVVILRDYGFPLEKIGVVRYCLFNPHLDPRMEYEEEYHQKHFQDKGYIDSKTLLGVGIAMMVIEKEPCSIVIPTNGLAYITKSKNVNPDSHPFLLIPLISVIDQFIARTDDMGILSGLGILSEAEVLILTQIRRNDIKEISIEFANGKSKNMKVTGKNKLYVEKEVNYLLSRFKHAQVLRKQHEGDDKYYLMLNFKLNK